MALPANFLPIRFATVDVDHDISAVTRTDWAVAPTSVRLDSLLDGTTVPWVLDSTQFWLGNEMQGNGHCRRLTLIALAVTTFSAGCGLQMPNFRSPGHVYQQQLQATIHDPYASPDFPGAADTRPPMYDLPLNTTVQSQWQLDQPPAAQVRPN